MKKPDPAPGLVIRYDYLWRDEQAGGREEGIKDRPCAVVIVRKDLDGKPLVLLAPITHSPPIHAGGAIEIPPGVKRHLELDDDRSWIVTEELNSVTWNDPGIVPVSRTRWDYGFLPPRLVTMIIDRIVARHNAHKLGIVDRAESKTRPRRPSPR